MTERFFEEELTGNVEGQKPQERTSYEGVEDAKFVEIKEGPGEDEGQNEIESEVHEQPPDDVLLYGTLSEETRTDAQKELQNLENILRSSRANAGSTNFENNKAKLQKLMQDPVGYYTDKTNEINKLRLQFPQNKKLQEEFEKYTRITIDLQNRKKSIDLKKRSQASEKAADENEQTKRTGEELVKSGINVVPYEAPKEQQEIEKNPVEKDKFFWLQTGQKDLMTLNVGDLTSLSEQQTAVAEDFAEMLRKTGLGAHRGGGGELSVDFTDMDSFPHLEEADKKELEYFNHAATFLIKGNKEKEGGKLKIDIRNNLLEGEYKAKRDMAAKILTRAFAKNMRKSEKSKGEIEKAIADYEAAERAKIDARVRVAQFLKFGKEEKGDDRVVARTMLSGLKGNGIPKLMNNDFYQEIFAMKGKKKETERLSEEAILDARALEEQMENYKAIGEFPTFRGKSAELLETIREQITQMRSKYGDVINKEKLPNYLK